MHAICVLCRRNAHCTAQAIKLSKIEKISSGILRQETTPTDAIQSILNYPQIFDEDYVVSFLDARTVNIVDKMMSSNILARSIKAPYLPYILIAKVIFKNEGVLPLLKILSMEAPVTRMLGITYPDDLGL